MRDLIRRLNKPLEFLAFADFLAPLALRLYLVPVFWVAGSNKLQSMESTIAWFGNPDWGLGLPLPALLAWLATLTEAIGAVLLLIGLGVRWISLPLMITMLVRHLPYIGRTGGWPSPRKLVFLPPNAQLKPQNA